MMKREYAQGTSLVTSGPWDDYTAATALCPDGKVRKVKRIATTGDTYFSIPASVTVKGKTIAGFLMVDGDPTTVRFVPYTYRKNHNMFAKGDES